MRGRARVMIAGLLASDDGLEVVEYAVIVGLIIAAALAVLAAIGTWALGIYQTLQSSVGA